MRLHAIYLNMESRKYSPHFDHTHPHVHLVFIFAIACTIGALLKTFRMLLLKIFPLFQIPAPAVLFILGIAYGKVKQLIGAVDTSSKLLGTRVLSDLNPNVGLYLFLPIIIFESAYNMDYHMFRKSLLQISFLALPGLILSALVMAIIVKFVVKLDWEFPVALLFGLLIGATDPISVSPVLKEKIGAAQPLSVLIEGEFLLNDGTAIVLFTVLFNWLSPEDSKTFLLSPQFAGDTSPGSVIASFLYIIAGGPVIGFIVGKTATLLLRNTYCDIMTQTAVTVSLSYVTFFVCQAIAGTSGILSVVVLGLIFSNDRGNINSEVEKTMQKFIEMLAYLTNTMLFLAIGIVCTEQNIVEYYTIPCFYVAVIIARGLAIWMLSPFLAFLGYGLTWRNAIVLIWGGIRGAVAVALSLFVAHAHHNKRFQDQGQQMVVYTLSIAFLTQCINGLTFPKLLGLLGLTQIPTAKRQAMASVLQILQDTRKRSINMLKLDRFLGHSDWRVVIQETMLKDPYATIRKQSTVDNLKIMPRAKCVLCQQHLLTEPTPSELDEMLIEASVRKLNAQKVSYWRQYEKGQLSYYAVQALCASVERALDAPGEMIHLSWVKENWEIKGALPKVKWFMERLFYGKSKYRKVYPSQKWRAFFFRLVNNAYFVGFIYCAILLNMIPLIMELAMKQQHFASNETFVNMEVRIPEEQLDTWNKSDITSFFIFGHHYLPVDDALFVHQISNYIFFVIYLFECIFKVTAYGRSYLNSGWNKLDAVILIVAASDIIFDLNTGGTIKLKKGRKKSVLVFSLGKILRLLRIGRLFRLFEPIIKRIISRLNQRIHKQLSLGFDVGKGFVVAEEEVSKYIDHMVDNAGIATRLKKISENQRLEVIKELGALQQRHPDIAMSVKSKQAVRCVLFDFLDVIKEQKHRGLIDDWEFSLLEMGIQEKIMRLSKFPSSLPPPDTIEILRNVPWIKNNEQVLDFIQEHGQLKNFTYGNILIDEGEQPQGIYIITSGVLRQSPDAKLDDESGDKQEEDKLHIAIEKGQLDNYEYVDYLGTGNVVGEMGILTLRPRAVAISCETAVQTIFISMQDMLAALSVFTECEPSLEYDLWRTCAIRIAFQIIDKIHDYEDETRTKLKQMLDRSYLISLEFSIKFTVDRKAMQDIVLIEGVVTDSTGYEFVAPRYMPKTADIIFVPKKSYMRTPPKMLIIPPMEFDSMHEGMQGTFQRCLRHAVRHRRQTCSTISLSQFQKSKLESKLARASVKECENVELGLKPKSVRSGSEPACKCPSRLEMHLKK